MFLHSFCGAELTWWTTDSWECRLSLNVVRSIPRIEHDNFTAPSSIISVSLCQSIKNENKNMYIARARPQLKMSTQVLKLTYWGRVTHICVGKLSIIGSDNGLTPERRQAIIWTNAGILLIGPLGTNLSEILIEILTFSFKKMRLKVSSAKWRPFCLGLNVSTPFHFRPVASCPVQPRPRL